MPLQHPEAQSARRGREPGADRRALAQLRPVFDVLQPGRLEHVVDGPGAKPVGARDGAEAVVEAGDEVLERDEVP